MSKKEDQHSEGLQDVMDSLFSPTAELSLNEVREALRARGHDSVRERERLHDAANRIAKSQRAQGKSAPPYLRRVLEQTAGPEKLPSDSKSALRVAREFLDSVLRPSSGIGTDFEIAYAFRGKDGELSTKDKRLLEATEKNLLERVKNDDSQKE